MFIATEQLRCSWNMTFVMSFGIILAERLVTSQNLWETYIFQRKTDVSVVYYESLKLLLQYLLEKGLSLFCDMIEQGYFKIINTFN